MFLHPPASIVLAAILALPLFPRGAAHAEDFPPKPPVEAKTVAEEQQSFRLPPGYRLEPVLAEPDIKEPVIAMFDGDGRMFVAEMRSYMQDIDAKDEHATNSRVSLHWSSKGDGVLDKHTIFADNLKLPRMLLPLGKGQVLIGETDTNDIYLYTDTKGEGVADKKELWYQGGPRGGNLEHQPNGFIWAIDNGLYSTFNNYRLKWTPKGAIKETVGSNNGQWGICQDSYGKLFFMNAGGERGPQSFEVPVLYGGFNPGAEFEKGFEEVWPSIGMADVQGGHGRHRADGTLNHFTATTGADVYRGDRLPPELLNDLFVGEPVGRLVRRAKVVDHEGLTTLSNPYQEEHAEFLRSTDPIFRPLNITNAPDGTLYIVDIYRGIIQEGDWVKPGSYLRNVVQQYAFDKVVGHGRIWRLVHDTTKLGPQPHMLDEAPAQLVAHLEHPNGWWRDAAQKLLVLSQDKSVVPALAQMAHDGTTELGRIHALWTLEGLGALDPVLVHSLMKDAHPQVRIAALRVSESLVNAGDASFQQDIDAMGQDSDADVALQSFLTARQLKLPNWQERMEALVAGNAPAGIKIIGSEILHPAAQADTRQLTAEEKKQMKAGADIYNTLCTTCHGPGAKGMPMVGAAPGAMLAPPLAGSKTINGHRNGPIAVLLAGLSGDINGKKYEGAMVSMATNNDEWVAAVLSYIRNSFGNNSSFVQPQDVARVRAALAGRTQPLTFAELIASTPQPLPKKSAWKVTASHNPQAAHLATDGNRATRYDTSAPQTPGMWFQIELPAEADVAGIELDAAGSTRDYPRGYKVELSTDGNFWGQPVAAGKGDGQITDITFPSTPARFVRITQTGSASGLFWSIHEIDLFGAPHREGAAAIR